MHPSALAIPALTGLALFGAIVLLALHIAVPDFLPYVIVTGFGAVAGVAVPSRSAAAARDTSRPRPRATRPPRSEEKS